MNSNSSSYILTVKIANYTQGILNIPIRFSDYFGEHGCQVILQIENRLPDARNLNRNNHTPRISSHLLQAYFQEKRQMGSQYIVTLFKNRININPVVSNRQ